MGNTTFFHCLAKRRGVTPFGLGLVVVLSALALCGGALLNGCTRSEVVATAAVVPQPSAAVIATVRTRVAASVKKLVQAHPATSPWLNGAAQVCFEISDAALPSPTLLKVLFSIAENVAPKALQPDVDSVLQGVLTVYTADYPVASTAQGASKNYLTLLGDGIQDGVKAAGVSEAP